MVDLATLKRLALALPEVEDTSGPAQWALSVHGKGIAWGYLKREAPKKPRILQPNMAAIRCLIETKEMLIETAADRFFDDDHYRGFPAVLVRLEVTPADELAGLLKAAWRLQAPKALVKRIEGG